MEVLHTPFGDISAVEFNGYHRINDHNLINELLGWEKELEEDENLNGHDYLAFLKNVIKRYSNEPLIFYELAKCHFDLGNKEKYEEQLKINY